MEEDVINPELEEKDCLMRFIMARQHDWAGQYKCSTDDAEEDAAGQDVQSERPNALAMLASQLREASSMSP
ncbi:TPA: hypothetical protein ACH3X1_011390 [Trebouxia sp. C0004]